MMSPVVRSIYAALNEVIDPCAVSAGASLSLCEMGLVQNVELAPDGAVTITLRLTSPGCLMGGFYFEPEVVKRVSMIVGVTSVAVQFGNPHGWSEAKISEVGRRKLELARERAKPGRAVRKDSQQRSEEAKYGPA